MFMYLCCVQGRCGDASRRIRMVMGLRALVLGCFLGYVSAFLAPVPNQARLVAVDLPLTKEVSVSRRGSPLALRKEAVPEDVDEVTKKYGLEAGLLSIFRSKDSGKTVKAKDLLTKYGSAYLLTSVSLSIVSFGACYAMINAGVDVGALLSKVGIQASQQTETAGTFALAYAAHKAASPIRFPPTVALTPIVANAIGKKIQETEGKEQ